MHYNEMNESHTEINLYYNVENTTTFSHVDVCFPEHAEEFFTFLTSLCNILGCFTCNYDNIKIDREETNAGTVTRTLISF